ncbi:urease accessory protein UreD [Rhodococcoides kyotonense]|uniref:Urease accessory protein UreD n=1 Tax=Rhodococcoides kyotonense TaxID=398843 RepID=A0A239LJG4_9NOCA|nr:urease accessory protein UreD [Rhodococcus kyotonensis]SNT29704.1 urease accessory protein [Rhodococcus kyotonensis]
MTAAAPTVEGKLAIDVVCGRNNRTRIAKLEQRFPQRITVPMYLDSEDPGMAFLCVQNPTGGAFPRDRIRTDIGVGTGCRLHLTAQSATQIYAGDELSTHDYRFTLSDGSLVEHFPKVAIPHAHSRFTQSTTIDMTGDSVFIGSESVASGRIGHGERFLYDAYKSRTAIEIDGTLQAVDNVRLEPGTRPTGLGAVASRNYYSSFLVVAPQRDLDYLKKEFNFVLRESLDVVGAASMLPNSIGVSARFLTDRAPTTQATTHALWDVARRVLLGRSPLTPRM